MNNFQIINNKIYDPSGQEFIIKGTNMFDWEGIGNVNSYVNNWGFNTVRVPNYLLGNYDQAHPSENGYQTNHQIVDGFTSQGAVVVFDAHDKIGEYYEDGDFEILKDYWRDMAQEFKDNPNVWFNLHNEPGTGNAQGTKWVEYHRELIDIIRAEGAENMIVVDGEGWGQDAYSQTIADNATSVMTGNENVMFSIHVYEQWNSADIGAYFDDLEANNIPFLIGEYGSINNGQDTSIASEKAILEAQTREIGRIAWSAKADDFNDFTTGNGGHAEHFDGSNPEILTDLGDLIWDDLNRVEDLDRLPDYDPTANLPQASGGIFEVGASGEIQFDFLYDRGWGEGELAIFNLEGMENYTLGTQEYIQQAALRAVSNSEDGYIVFDDQTEGAKFTDHSIINGEGNQNLGQYLGTQTFEMSAGGEFGIIFLPNGDIQDIADNPASIWQPWSMPFFSIPEANPGYAEAQIAQVDEYGTFSFEDSRIDWNYGDRDYNDFVFQVQGASTENVPSVDDWQNLDIEDWRTTDIGLELLDYSDRIVIDVEGQTLDGSSIADTLIGDLGNDLLNGKAGQDSLYGESGNDTLAGGNGKDSLWGGEGEDLLKGNRGQDTLFGEDGNDTLNGGRGKDTLLGGSGDDLLQGGKGNDSLEGGIGNDTLAGNNGKDTLFGSTGDDLLRGGKGNDNLAGESGNDTLQGGYGNDTLLGGNDDDLLRGGKGNDWLSGELGNDILLGGNGRDIFAIANDGSTDRIQDFQNGTDLIQLSDELNFKDLAITQGIGTEEDHVLLLAEDSTIAILENIDLISITSLDFI